MSCTCQGRLAVRRRDDHPGVMSVSAESIGSGPSADEERPAGRRVRAGALLRRRLPVLVAGALPVLAFPRPGQDWLAWVALMPGLLLLAVAAGALWAPWGDAAWARMRPGRLLAAVVVVPSVWLAAEWARSWQ